MTVNLLVNCWRRSGSVRNSREVPRALNIRVWIENESFFCKSAE